MTLATKRPPPPAVVTFWKPGLFLIALGLLSSLSARAAEEPDADGISAPSIATSLPQNGDPGGLRKWLASHGITYTLVYTNDVLGNVRGGNRRGFIDQGKLEAALSIDLEKLARLEGLSFYANAFQIHNTGRIRQDYVGGINTIAAIEAVPTTRLSELWLERKFWNDKASIRAGQLAADVEFFFAGVSEIFLQSDWPTIAHLDMPNGHPAYPLATPGVRFKLEPMDNVVFQLAVYNGSPAGFGPGEEEIRNRHGLNFRIQDPPLVMAEAQFRTNQGKKDRGLARTVKLGGWAHFGSFDDQRFANDGTLLANPAGSGVAALRRGNFGVYGIFEQQLYRPAGGDASSGVSVFGRVSASPSENSPINFYVDGGIVFAGMIPSRPDDRFGASFIFARYSASVRGFDLDQIAYSGLPGVVRDAETNLELTYQAQIVPGWTVQPVLTRIWHPSGDASRNATVTGIRSIWRY